MVFTAAAAGCAALVTSAEAGVATGWYLNRCRSVAGGVRIDPYGIEGAVVDDLALARLGEVAALMSSLAKMPDNLVMISTLSFRALMVRSTFSPATLSLLHLHSRLFRPLARTLPGQRDRCHSAQGP